MSKEIQTIFTLLLCSTLAMGQHMYESHSAAADHENFPPFRIAAMIGHTIVPEGADPDRNIIPSWGLDLEWWFNHQWAIGVHSDLEIHSYLVEHENHEMELERDFPLVVTLDGLVKVWKGLTIQAGPGFEFEPEEHFFLMRAGLEYEFEIGNHWDIAPTVFYDTRFDAFDTWTVGLSVGKKF
jgi:hypothetical protein